MKQGKIWGDTTTLFNKNNVEFHRINIKKGGKCSKHKHEHKHNLFYIEKGSLEIKVWKNCYNLCDITILNTGEMSTINPSEFHQFTALEDTIAYEIYWVELRTDDIVRDGCGSLNE